MTINKTIIVSMCTYKYNDWIIYFYNGIRRFNPDIKIVIYLINYPKEHANLLRCFFKDIDFIEKKGKFILKPTFNDMKEKECVTYLKGQFVKETMELYKKPCLWIDITALIRTDLIELSDMLHQNDCILNRRNFERDSGKTVLAAEIFGIRNYELAKFYAQECNKEPTSWYSDQENLCKLLHKTDKIGYIKFGDYSNFYFDKKAKSWSDRGKTGNGTFNSEDKEHNFNEFYNDLSLLEGFSEDFLHFMDLFTQNKKKPWIMCYIDEDRWCYYTTAMTLCKYLSKDFYISIVRNVYVDREIIDNFKGDLVWARCNSHRVRPLLNIRPDLEDKFIPTMTTGGKLLQSRINIHKNFARKSKYILTQNQESYDVLLNQTNQKPILIPNGVDTERFKPIDRNPNKKFIIGFAARHSSSATDAQKGYTKLFKEPCKELGLKILEGNSGVGFIPHNEIHKFYDKIDVLVQVSDSEGCSNTINEAMSAGIPCVISRVGYHGEVCEHDKEVLFVDRDKEQVKEALLRLQNPIHYNRISKGAREFALRHTWNNISKKFKETFMIAIKKSKHL